MDLRVDLQKLRQKNCGNASIDMNTNPNLLAKRQVDELINLVVDTSILLKSIPVVRRTKCKGEIPRLDVRGIASEGANTTTCPRERGLVDSYVSYDMTKYRTSLSLSGDFLTCNEYGDGIKDLAVNMIRTQVANDMEAAAIEGDETLPTGDSQSDYNNLMGVNDGFIALAKCCVPQCQILDAAGAGPSAKLFMEARKKLPARYRRQLGVYKFIMGPQLLDWWALLRAGRETPEGDAALLNGNNRPMWGHDLFHVPMWPENFPIGGNATGTHVLFTPLDNLLFFVMEEMMLEWERIPSCDKWAGYLHWWADFQFRNPDMVVLIKNIDPCGTPYDMCGDGCDGDRQNDPGCAPPSP